MSAGTVLEGRYRRLLRMYPAGHRRKHQDEMLGVLMTGARAAQHRPGLADTANLIWGALLIRLRPARPGTAWREADARRDMTPVKPEPGPARLPSCPDWALRLRGRVDRYGLRDFCVS